MMLLFTIRADNRDGEIFAKADWNVKALQVEASDNVFATSPCFLFRQWVKTALPPAEAESCLARMAGWKGERNVYAAEGEILALAGMNASEQFPPPNLAPGLAGWKQFWETAEVGSLEGQVHFQGDDLLARLQSLPDKLTPDDFRPRPDSAGYRAGPDGKDLGADVDLVGPGAAYERWKKTPEYQEWLKATGQMKRHPDVSAAEEAETNEQPEADKGANAEPPPATK